MLEFASYLHTSGMQWDAPFELKRRIIKIVVDRLSLDTGEQYFRIEGKISGRFAIHGAIAGSNADKDSSPIIQLASKGNDARI